MSTEQLNAAARYFLQQLLPAATGKRLTDLQHAEVLLGAYRRHTGAAVTVFGRSIAPRYMLKVSPQAAALSDGLPTLAGAVGDTARDQPLVWLRFAADAKVDDEATIRDLIGDLDTYTQRRFNVQGVDIDLGADAPTAPDAARWATAIVAARAALPDDLSTLTAVPAQLAGVAPTVQALRMVLGHFFTYDEGHYYARWAGAGRRLPDDLSPVYKEKNVAELQLQREQLYLYMLAPKRLFTTAQADDHDYREAIFRFDATGNTERPFLAHLVHCAYRRITTPTPFHDFVFFESEDGLGLAIPAGARASLSTALTHFLAEVPEVEADRAAFFDQSKHVIAGTPPLVQLLATVEGDLALPTGARSGDAGPVRSILAPLDTVLPLAALPAVRYLDLDGNPEQPTLDMVLPAVAFDAYRAKFPAGKKDGAGVIVGVIDTGIDGSHETFLDGSGSSRILAVWQQDEGAAGNASSPAAGHSGNAAYNDFNYGREYTGGAVTSARDSDDDVAHGTHVAGIAAGRGFTGAAGNVPRGMASEAKIVAVRTIGVNQGNVDHAIRYIFLKADEEGARVGHLVPCVINMSFGSHDHAHDGTDVRGRFISRQLRDSAGHFKPGRVLVAAAANDRGDPIHVKRDITAGGWTFLRYQVNAAGANSSRDLATIWLRHAAATAPVLLVWVQHVPTGWSSNIVTLTTPTLTQKVSGRNLKVLVDYQVKDIHNGDYNLRVNFFRNTGSSALPTEEWRIFVVNYSQAIELHAWSARFIGAFLGWTAADDAVTVASPGTSRDVVTVASTNSRLSYTDIDGVNRNFGQTRLGDISSYSSPGPLRTCSARLLSIFGLDIDLTHDAIDIAAPGSAIISAKAGSLDISTTHPAGSAADLAARRRRRLAANAKAWVLQGTSMASPAVTGLVACLLADEPNLTQEQVYQRVRAAGHLPAPAATNFDAGHPDVNDWGQGLLHSPSLKP